MNKRIIYITVVFLIVISGCVMLAVQSVHSTTGFSVEDVMVQGCMRIAVDDVSGRDIFERNFDIALSEKLNVTNAGENRSRVRWMEITCSPLEWKRIDESIRLASTESGATTRSIKSYLNETPNVSVIRPLWWPKYPENRFRVWDIKVDSSDGLNRGAYPKQFSLGYDERRQKIYLSYVRG